MNTNWMRESLQILKDGYLLLFDLKVLLTEYLKNKPQPLLNKFQVMEVLHISDSTYRRYVKEGRLKPMQLKGIDMYYESDIHQELQESRRKGRT